MTKELIMNMVQLVNVVVWPLFGVAVVLLVIEAIAARHGSTRRAGGWGFIGFILLVNAVFGSILSVLVQHSLPDHPDIKLALPLDVITLVASIAFGGLGTNLLAHWLTSLKPPTR